MALPLSPLVLPNSDVSALSCNVRVHHCVRGDVMLDMELPFEKVFNETDFYPLIGRIQNVPTIQYTISGPDAYQRNVLFLELFYAKV